VDFLDNNKNDFNDIRIGAVTTKFVQKDWKFAATKEQRVN
jgi:hypothetical protein